MALDDRQLRPPSLGIMVGIVVGVALLILLSASVVIVPAGERAVIFDKVRGVLEDTRKEGLTFVVPFVQQAVRYDIKTQTYNLGTDEGSGSNTDNVRRDNSVEGLTRDGQKVDVELSVRFHPKVEEVWKLHQQVGTNYVGKIVIPEVRSVVRTVISEYDVMDVYSRKRREIQERIQKELTGTFSNYYIQLNEVLIRNLRFSEEFQKAIEAKQVALQDAQRMQYVLQKEKLEKQRKIIDAEGEAQSINLRGKALSANPRLIQYEYVQKLSPGIKGIITDQNTILNMSSFLEGGK